MSVRTITTTLSGTPPLIRGDHPNRRKIMAELAAVREELQRSSAVNTPVMRCLGLWYQEFHEALRHPDPDEVIRRFQGMLEEIFENPLQPQTPFAPKLFGTEPLPLVRFMIAKMRDRNSLLYSARVDAAAPAASPRACFERVSAVLAERRRREEQNNPEFQELRQRLIARRQAQEAKLQAIDDKARQKLTEIGQEIQATRNEIDHHKNTVERLEKETARHKEEVVKLEGQLAEVKNQADAVVRDNIQLNIRINSVEAAIKEEKSSWLKELGCLVLTIAVKLVLDEVAPGSSAIFGTHGGAVGKTWPI